MNMLRSRLSPRPGGFTLIEILVAVAVLSIVVVGLSQILSLSMQTWQVGMSRTNCYTKARVVLDSVTADIQRGVFRSDVRNFPTPASTSAPTFTFYTRASGPTTGTATVRPVSLVTYQLSSAANLQGYLLRSENTIAWTGTGPNIAFYQAPSSLTAMTLPASGPPNDLLSTGVVQLEMIFLLADGTTLLAKNYKYPTSSPVVMIGVAVAVIDDKVLTLIQPASSPRFGTLQSTLETALSTSFSLAPAVNYGRSIKEVWDPAIAPLYAGNAYPKAFATGFQTFERFVPCTPFN
jgi:prepilin-type N-terminal cleavage/methylation domain-containing protein